MIDSKESHKDNSARGPDLVSLSSLRSETDGYWYSVLALCHQPNPTHFGLEFPSSSFSKFEYLDSGTYSHVIKANDVQLNNTPVVFKIIKVLQKATLSRLSELSFKGFELYQDVYQEIVIIKMLSNLHLTVCDSNGFEYQTHSFPRVYRTRVVHGEIPNYFLIRQYDESIPKIKPVERFDDLFGVPREHLVILMKFGGDSLWDRIQAHAKVGISPGQLLSVCFQVAFALAVSEVVYEFEHRDLHVCNILVKPTKKKHVLFKLRSVEYRVKSFGVKACIIDATFSRIAMNGKSYYTDLTSRLKGTAANPNPDGQEIAYQQMYKLILDQWREWFPQSNIIWLKYFFNEILTSDAFSAEADEQEVRTLKQLISCVADYKKVSDFVLSMFQQGGNKGSTDAVSRTPATSMSNL